MSLSIIIPCRNEEENIKETITHIENVIKDQIENYEFIIINDFSNDSTLELVQKISNINPKVKPFNNNKIGLGGAINMGINNALNKFTVIVMADLSDSPQDILLYYNEIRDKNLDAVLGTRFSVNSKVTDYPKKKLILNRIFNYVVKFLFWQKYDDYTNAFKIYKTASLKEIRPIVSENFNIFLELPLKIITRKYQFSIVPISWKNRTKGEAKFKFKELGSKYLFTLLYCFLEKILLR